MIQSTFKPVFLLIPTDWSRLRVAQMPRSRDLVIFMVTTEGQTDRQTNYFTPAHARGGTKMEWGVGDHEGEMVNLVS